MEQNYCYPNAAYFGNISSELLSRYNIHVCLPPQKKCLNMYVGGCVGGWETPLNKSL
jgi:hypothetical protein